MSLFLLLVRLRSFMFNTRGFCMEMCIFPNGTGATANPFILARLSPAAGRGQVLGWGDSRELSVLEAMH